MSCLLLLSDRLCESLPALASCLWGNRSSSPKNNADAASLMHRCFHIQRNHTLVIKQSLFSTAF